MKYHWVLLTAVLFLVIAGSIVYALNCNVSFTTLAKLQESGYCQTRDWVITNQTDFCSFWNQAHMLVEPVPPCPTVDFSNYVVIATAMGRKSNACYNTEIYCIEQGQGGNYTVYVRDTYPAKGMFCPTMIVCPVHAVQVPIPSGGVTFRHTR